MFQILLFIVTKAIFIPQYCEKVTRFDLRFFFGNLLHLSSLFIILCLLFLIKSFHFSPLNIVFPLL